MAIQSNLKQKTVRLLSPKLMRIPPLHPNFLLKPQTHRGLRNSPMKAISWNCQGLAKPKAVRALKLLLKSSKPDIIFISEVKIPLSTSISKALSSHSLSNISFVPPAGKAGGLILAWSHNINLNITLLNSSFIHASIHDLDSPPWFFTGIYCPCNHIGRTNFWNSINTLHDMILFLHPGSSWEISMP